jgi:DNA-binding transcriptional ArsR family regulator
MEAIVTGTNLQMDILELKKAKLILRAINHPLRQHMLQLLHQNKQMTVTSIYGKLRLEQSLASQHLAILRQAGFLNTTREARFIFYSVNYQRLQQVHSIAAQLISH